MAAVSRGGTISAALPATSGRELVLVHMTGVPHACPSNTGKPKPSYNDGYAKTRAPEINAASTVLIFGETGTGRVRNYVHDELEAEKYDTPPGDFTDWRDIDELAYAMAGELDAALKVLSDLPPLVFAEQQECLRIERGHGLRRAARRHPPNPRATPCARS